MKLKRRRLKLTDYRKRLALIKSGLPRAVIRKSIKNLNVDITEFNPTGDKVVAHGGTVELKKFGWNSPTGNIPSSYLAGYLAGKRAKKKGVKKVIIDLGRQKVVKGSRIMATVKGLTDSGVKVPVEKKLFPKKDRLTGKHLKTVSEDSIEPVKKAMEESL